MDSRFSIKVTFKIYGKESSWDASLNWCAPDGEIDRNITEFFLNSYEAAYAAYESEERIASLKRIDEQREEQERSELKRLLEKYPITPPRA